MLSAAKSNPSISAVPLDVLVIWMQNCTYACDARSDNCTSPLIVRDHDYTKLEAIIYIKYRIDNPWLSEVGFAILNCKVSEFDTLPVLSAMGRNDDSCKVNSRKLVTLSAESLDIVVGVDGEL